jgi:exosome complex RNA-binding protein Csl4
LALSLSSSTVSSGSPATVTAKVLDGTGAPVPSVVVDFKSKRDLGTFSVASALTNASGEAVVSLVPKSVSSSGADEVEASATVSGVQVSDIEGYQLQATDVTITSFTGPGSTLSAYGQASLSLAITGAAAGSPVNVALTSSCVAQGKASISPATVTMTSGTQQFQYKDNGCGAVQASDVIQASVVSTTVSRSLNLQIASPALGSIAFIEASPNTIYLKGSGLTEVSNVTFEVRDEAGAPLPGRDVLLSLTTFTGGLTLDGGTASVTRTTNALGRVTARINSGTVPTPVRVSASVNSGSIQTVSSALSVAVGLPSELNFSLSQKTINIEGYNLDGTPNSYTIRAADRSGNPVPDLTSINFVAEGGQIESQKLTGRTPEGIAVATANFVSASPRPDDGRVTVVAYTLGEESFMDQNGNNAFNAGEPFQDLGDIFKDRYFDNVYDSAVDEFISLDIAGSGACAPSGTTTGIFATDASIPTRPNTCDGVWGKAYVRRAIETVFSTSGADPVWVNPAVATDLGAPIPLWISPNRSSAKVNFYSIHNTKLIQKGANGIISFYARDQNDLRFNPIAAGSEVTASGDSNLESVKVFGGTIVNTSEPPPVSVEYKFKSDAVADTVGAITITLTSPVTKTGTIVRVYVVR